jgi:hypothetical protein
MQVPTLVHPQKCGILNSRGGANGGKASCRRGMKTFGELISELRKQRGLTQKALAAQVKKKDGVAIGIAYINDIEHTTAETRHRPISWRNWRRYWEYQWRFYSTTQDGSRRMRNRAIRHISK